MRRLIWAFAVRLWRRDNSHVSIHFFFNRQRIPNQAARRMYRLIRVFSVLTWRRDKGDKCSIKLNINQTSFCCGNFQQTAKSKSGCADAQSHMDIRCSYVAKRQLTFCGAFLFIRQQSPDQAARIRRYRYSLLSCGDGTAVMFRHTFFKRQQSPDQAALIRMIIRVFAVIMWRRYSCHVSAHFFFQQTANSSSSCDTQVHMGIRCSLL